MRKNGVFLSSSSSSSESILLTGSWVSKISIPVVLGLIPTFMEITSSNDKGIEISGGDSLYRLPPSRFRKRKSGGVLSFELGVRLDDDVLNSGWLLRELRLLKSTLIIIIIILWNNQLYIIEGNVSSEGSLLLI